MTDEHTQLAFDVVWAENETRKHQIKVHDLILVIVDCLLTQSIRHDDSKFSPTEWPYFSRYTRRLADMTYGSDEYKQCLAEMKPGVDAHYAANSHHPEHHSRGINGMTLIDLLETLADWRAATMRHKDGDIVRSLAINMERFKIDGQLAGILANTMAYLNWAHDGAVRRAVEVVKQQRLMAYDEQRQNDQMRWHKCDNLVSVCCLRLRETLQQRGIATVPGDITRKDEDVFIVFQPDGSMRVPIGKAGLEELVAAAEELIENNK